MLRTPFMRPYDPRAVADRPLSRWFRWVLVVLSVAAGVLMAVLWRLT